MSSMEAVVSERDTAEIERRFGFHPTTPEVVATYRAIRDEFIGTAKRISALTPDSREKSLFLTALQEAKMWAMGSVATNLTPLGVEGSGAR